MHEYRYIGIADEVSFSKEDFTRHDVTDQDAVVFNAGNNFTQPLSEAAVTMLKANGFQMMKAEDYQSFLDNERAKLAEAAKLSAETAASPTPPIPSAAELQIDQPAPVPERPARDADRDELANYAWTHYMIPVDTAEHNMTKAEINKALDKAEAEKSA